MATSTFDREIEIKDVESAKKLFAIMEQAPSKKMPSRKAYTTAERERSVELLKQCLYRSRKR